VRHDADIAHFFERYSAGHSANSIHQTSGSLPYQR
jgi:hypothetical protein